MGLKASVFKKRGRLSKGLLGGWLCLLVLSGLGGCHSPNDEGNPQPTGKPPNPPQLLPANPNRPRPHLNMGGGSPSGGGSVPSSP